MAFDFDPFGAVLLDLDGTIYREDHVLPGAAELVRRLQARRKKFACLSNSTFSPEHVSRRLGHMGIAIPPAQIHTAAAAAVDYVLGRFGDREGSGTGPRGSSRPRVYNLATEGAGEMLDGRVTWVNSADEACDAVIVGTPTNVYATEDRQRAALVLLRHGAVLVGICADRVFPSPRGLEFGAGALSAMLGYAADVEPIFTGKPQAIFFRTLCQHLAVSPADCLLIGDNLESDIAGAKSMGMKSMLVLTGVTREKDVVILPSGRTPDRVIGSLEELV